MVEKGTLKQLSFVLSNIQRHGAVVIVFHPNKTQMKVTAVQIFVYDASST